MATAISVPFVKDKSFSNSNLLCNGLLVRPHTNQSLKACFKRPQIYSLLQLGAGKPNILLPFCWGLECAGETCTSQLLLLAWAVNGFVNMQVY